VARTQFGAVGGWRFVTLVVVVVAAWRISWWILLVIPALLLIGVLFMLFGRADTQARLALLIPDPAVREMVVGFTAEQFVNAGQLPETAISMAEAVLVQRPEVARERAAVARRVLNGQREQAASVSELAGPTAVIPTPTQPPAARRAQRPQAVARRAQRKRR